MTDPHTPYIRQLREYDAESFRRIRLEALQHDPLAFRATYKDEAGLPLDYFRDRLVNGLVYGAHIDDGLVATAGIDTVSTSPIAGMLWGVYVQHGQRGHGLARSVIERALAAAEPRYAEIRLRVKATNTPARAVYARLGFALVSHETAVASDGRAYEYEWWLRPMPGPKLRP